MSFGQPNEASTSVPSSPALVTGCGGRRAPGIRGCRTERPCGPGRRTSPRAGTRSACSPPGCPARPRSGSCRRPLRRRWRPAARAPPPARCAPAPRSRRRLRAPRRRRVRGRTDPGTRGCRRSPRRRRPWPWWRPRSGLRGRPGAGPRRPRHARRCADPPRCGPDPSVPRSPRRQGPATDSGRPGSTPPGPPWRIRRGRPGSPHAGRTPISALRAGRRRGHGRAAGSRSRPRTCPEPAPVPCAPCRDRPSAHEPGPTRRARPRHPRPAAHTAPGPPTAATADRLGEVAVARPPMIPPSTALRGRRPVMSRTRRPACCSAPRRPCACRTRREWGRPGTTASPA